MSSAELDFFWNVFKYVLAGLLIAGVLSFFAVLGLAMFKTWDHKRTYRKHHRRRNSNRTGRRR